MFVTDLESRRNKIVELIIEVYIETGIPVSSRTISNKFRLGLSPATIRNVMADLEEAGLITHPHTSAGRIPTERGYRFYVNKLMQAKQLTINEKNRIKLEFEVLNKELEEVISKASRILSLISSQTGIILFPCLRESAFSRLELLPVEHRQILVVLLTKSGITKDFVLDFPEEINGDELSKITKFLNGEFGNMPLGQIKRQITNRLLQERGSFFYILEKTNEIIDRLINSIDIARLHFEGTSYILDKPEFNNLDKARGVIRVLEDQSFILDILQKDLGTDGVKIHIGMESGFDELKECTLITCNYKIKGDNCGSLGVIGPLRMEYSRMVSLVDYVSGVLSQIFS